MPLESGARTIVESCLDISSDERVLIVDDGNDEKLIESLLDVVKETESEWTYVTYEEPEHHGVEPPAAVSASMKGVDVVIAPTKKSITHTAARREACESGARVATLPGINQEIWTTSLQADYEEVARITQAVYEHIGETNSVQVTTPTGTDLRFDIDIAHFHKDTGLIHEGGQFGNLPAGETDGGVSNMSGQLVVDHFPFAPSGTTIEIEETRIVKIDHPGGGSSELAEAIEDIECARVVAEFGFGTNPEATLIGNILQDEKALGTVHFAFGDSTSFTPEGHSNYNSCEIHWDTICDSPTVYFDDTIMLEEGEAVFLD